MNAAAARPCIVCVAITGSAPRKAHNPAVPVTIAVQVESTHEAFEAGASIAHLHVRNDDEAFDLSHIFQAAAMAKDGRLQGPLYVQFVMGVSSNPLPEPGPPGRARQ